jgi:hypothetical protein
VGAVLAMRGWLTSLPRAAALVVVVAATLTAPLAAGAATTGQGAIAHAGVSGRAVGETADQGPVYPPSIPGFGGVSCVGADWCMAVGASDGTKAEPVAELWDGKRWRQLAMPDHADGLVLFGVSCASRSLCMAAGWSGIVKWNGRRWTVQATPASVNTPVFWAISCATASSCVAAGQQDNLHPRTLAEQWNGSAWTVLGTVNPAGATSSGLAGISCVSAADCIAVGSYTNGNYLNTLAEAWNGTSWRQLTLPAATDPGELSAVSCPSAAGCIAVGRAGTAVQWNGTMWTELTGLPLGMTAISCASLSRCVAAGATDIGPQENFGPVSASWNGSTWTPLTTPDPPGSALGGVSCPAAASCLAVGATNSMDLAMWWDGTKWTVSRTNRSDELSGVWCTRAARCMAVGSYIDTSDNPAVLAPSWNGQSWKPTKSPVGVAGDLADVSCTSAARCVGIGSNLAEAWNGRTWRVTPTGTLAFVCAGNAGCAVSCAGAHCLEVGRSMTANLWNGTTWRALHPPVPHGTYGSELDDVSCVTARDCLAVGEVFPSLHGNADSLAELWNGRTWKIIRAPGGGLASVSCVRQSWCMAVTGYTAETWNGSGWHVTSIPGPIDQGPGIVAVSCTSKSACLAVGNYATGVSNVNEAAAWNGTSWRRLRPASPGGSLTDVSCTRPSRCIAVGQTGPLPQTLAEQWNGTRWSLLRTPNP